MTEIDYIARVSLYPRWMLTIVAIILALFVLPSPWGWLTVLAAAVIDLLETWFFWCWSRRRRSVVGSHTLVGRRGVVVTTLAPRGKVRVSGELWQAESTAAAAPGQEVVIRGVDGLVLTVEPTDSPRTNPV